MSTVLQVAVTSGFSCAPELSGTRLLVTFEGTGDVAAVELLTSYVQQVHAEVLRLGLTEVRCDFRKVSFMNSSCFKSFVVWIDRVKNLPQPYQIRFVTEPSMQWQRRSLEALRRLATSVVIVEEG
ncbi:MAG: hypothetical protein K0R38_646 [Polyangiaceae bacterium]|nr:hypothetical protein [Polyangiaceae bacterium]